MTKRRPDIREFHQHLLDTALAAAPAWSEDRYRWTETERTEADLWIATLHILATGVCARKPDAIPSIMRHIEQLDHQMSALVIQRDIAEIALAGGKQWAMRESDSFVDGTHGPDRFRMVERLNHRIAGFVTRIAQLAAMLQEATKLPPKDSDAGPTPEMLSQPARMDPITLLEMNETLNFDQVKAARQIAWINEVISEAGQARIGRMESAGRPPKHSYRQIAMNEDAARIHAERYLPWAARLHEQNPVALDVTIKVAVYGVSLKALARHHKRRYDAILDFLKTGLDTYWNDNGRWKPALKPGVLEAEQVEAG